MSLEAATDELYGADLDSFVAERARLTAELKAAGAAEDAAALRQLRKPSVAAWTLNQLARRERRDVDVLLDAGHRLREAQAGVLQGAERDAFERARKTQQDALARLTRAAEQLLRGRGGASATTLGQVAESLRAAAVSEVGRELLARGRFVQPLQPQGFDVVGALAAAAPPPGRSRRAPVRKAQEAARAAVRDAKERQRAAADALRDAEREAARRRAEWERAERQVEEARTRLDAAAAETAEAEAALRRAQRRD